MSEGVDTIVGLDVLWLAADSVFVVCAATSVEAEAVPRSIRSLACLSRVADLVYGLSRVCTADLMTGGLPIPDDFVAYAERGLFAYDWTDVHRTRASSTGRYELICRPRSPRALRDLTAPPVVEVPRFTGSRFGESGSIFLDLDAREAFQSPANC